VNRLGKSRGDSPAVEVFDRKEDHVEDVHAAYAGLRV